jgi:hypothetical protein
LCVDARSSACLPLHIIPTLSLEKHERQGWGNRCKALKGVHHMPRLRGAKAPLFHEISDSNLGSSQGVKRQFVSR